jgi:hypothetical protein
MNYSRSQALCVYIYIYKRVMIEYYSKTQFFTTLPMWQGGPHYFLIFFLFLKKIMIQCHINIQLFTILFMWQGGPPLFFEFFFYFFKIN